LKALQSLGEGNRHYKVFYSKIKWCWPCSFERIIMNNLTFPPHDRYCDLVMKGGITSGIIYPPLACRLSKHYRFKNIGGTSAGAIAAVATAAAEYLRRQDDSKGTEAFDKLGKLHEELGSKLPCSSKTKLLSLFQPTPGCHRLFKVLLISMNAGGTWRRVVKILIGFLYAYWPATLISIATAALIVWFGYGAHAAILSSIILLLLLVGIWVYLDITRNLVRNNYGMCTGMSGPGCKHDALTPWLHELIQDLAGLEKEGKPLTFGDLWQAKGFPPDWLELPPGETIRSIDLQMFTTNLSHGRPYIFPLTNEKSRLFYLPEELSPLLPEKVMAWILEHSKDYEPDPKYPRSEPPVNAAPKGLKELPPPEVFPVLLAARMSLSFPLLFSAIPLWAIDYECEEGKRSLQRCMFSDGGISSNFPIHLFDGLLPVWPTFGVQLEPKLSCRDNMIYLPTQYYYGWGERWNRFADEKNDKTKRPASRMGGFLAAVVSTMQNWNDNTLSRMPGVRDRVVRIRLYEGEGGMNLKMDSGIIGRVAKRGVEAAEELLARFAPNQNGGLPALGWDEQRWIRFGVSLAMLQKRFVGVHLALDGTNGHATHYDDLIKQGLSKQLPGEQNPLTQGQVNALLDVVQAMRNFNKELSNSSPYSFEPIPEPDLRVRPSL
jgi:predicted acylesterase/phospholipase RssA